MNLNTGLSIDLHMHSTYSDGSFTPEELAALAKKKELAAVSLTDHDTAAGTPEMLEACDRLGIQAIPGIELSCTWQGKSVHILGYGMDWQAPGFLEQLAYWQTDRENRNQKIVKKLQNGGFDISMEALHRHFKGAVLTRANIAVYLAEKDQIADKDTAFSKLIGKGCPYYVSRKPVAPEEAISFLLSYGGMPVFAHPILCHMCEMQLDSFTGHLKALGLRGIEGYYSGYTSSDEASIARIAKKHGLFLTGGSDFHGTAKPSVSLGTGKGNLRVPYSCFLNLVS
ncbi:PHP domain-containing protein [Lacrimispora sp. NSJ-141]|uniref:PHP domain-containing protein n=1 Tax=Lientehia hominis TaxID=2897778 RepID=A0AAP2RJ57_9FIRM|nr:PHP domain-containing protein [Lientehia hominis]MCD2492711.1 PHP domain-containing protein [Lientehia hominis]